MILCNKEPLKKISLGTKMKKVTLINPPSPAIHSPHSDANKYEVFLSFSGYSLALFIILSAILPGLYSYVTTHATGHIFTYVNGWDEETYLSYQGALGVKNLPGYYSLYLVVLLHKMGISGAIQNMLFDLILIPVTIYFTARMINHFVNNQRLSFLYSVIVLFSSVLFNYSNPLIDYFYGARHISPVISGWESYPSLLRSPNPLFSYFIIALTINVYWATKRSWVLIVPLGLLYYFVFQPYLYCLSVARLFVYFKNKKEIPYIILYNVLAFIIMGTFAYLAFNHLLSSHSQQGILNLNGTPHIQIERNLFFPLYTLFAGILLGIAYLLDILKNKEHQLVFISLTLCTFFISNIQLITGVVIEIKNFQDYGNSILIGLILIVFLECLKTYSYSLWPYRMALIITLSLISYCSLHILTSPRMQLNDSSQLDIFTPDKLAVINKFPLESLVLDRNLAAKISYGHSQMPSLLTSYTMNFPFIFSQCACFYKLAEKAHHFLNERNITNEALNSTLMAMKKVHAPKQITSYCAQVCPDMNKVNFIIY